jgi:hypothetical protein
MRGVSTGSSDFSLDSLGIAISFIERVRFSRYQHVYYVHSHAHTAVMLVYYIKRKDLYLILDNSRSDSD